MAEIERLTITLPADMAAAVKGGVSGGDYASTSEVVREALRDWKIKRALQLQELAGLKTEIDRGLTDLAEDRAQGNRCRWDYRARETAISTPLPLRLTEVAEANLSEIWVAPEASEDIARPFVTDDRSRV